MFLQVIAGNGWFTVLLILWAVFLFGGFIFGKPHENGKRRMPTWTRMASSLTLVIAAWGMIFAAPGTIALLVALGMTLGFIGDLFMARLLPMKNHVLGGIGAFGIGHIIYILAFFQTGLLTSGTMPSGESAPWSALVIWWLIGAWGWYFVVFRGQTATPLHYAALPYALLLSSTAGLATMLGLTAPAAYAWLAVGAALFLLSDLILAGELFSGLNFPLIGDVVWLTYGPAQMFIVFSMIGAMMGNG